MLRRVHRSDRASALVGVALVATIMLGISLALLAASLAQSRAAESACRLASALDIAEAGAQGALDDLNRSGTGALGSEGEPLPFAGGTYWTEVFELGDPIAQSKAVASRALYARAVRAVEIVVRRVLSVPKPKLRGALTTRSAVEVSGNFDCDGRDWDRDGTAVTGPGLFGVSSMAAIAVVGSSVVGGNGRPPTGAPVPGFEVEPFAPWPDGYPSGPDEALGLSLGTLREMAQRGGTFCPSAGAWDVLLAANGGSAPGGKVLYIDADSVSPFDLGTGFSEPSILVLHNASNSAVMGHLKGRFRGLVLTDDIQYFSSNTEILGAAMTFRELGGGNKLGIGNAALQYSSTVLAQLPPLPAPTYSIVAWREFPAYVPGRPPGATEDGTASGF
ncbi:MAG: hypothetical protein HYZ53_11165 [Planctomycetes bacterium]|nr:hypothetical protein [Planctomycetota bacterium]